MPILNGFEASKQIKQHILDHRVAQKTIIIAISANSKNNKNELKMQYGIDEYLVKPVKKEDILRYVKKHLDLSEVLSK